MSPCRRFEEEALLLLEKGETLPEHFRTCPDCRRAASKYERLRQDLAEIEEDVLPPEGWQDAVRERIRAEAAEDPGTLELKPRQDPGTSRRTTTWKSVALAAAALTAAVVGGSLLLSPPPPEGLTMSLRKGEQVRRSTEAAPGDVLTLEAASRAAHSEIRLYRNDRELIARCGGGAAVVPAESECKMEDDRVLLTVTLPAVGSYQPLVLRSSGAMPEPEGDLDEDTGGVLETGGQVELGAAIQVR